MNLYEKCSKCITLFFSNKWSDYLIVVGFEFLFKNDHKYKHDSTEYLIREKTKYDIVINFAINTAHYFILISDDSFSRSYNKMCHIFNISSKYISSLSYSTIAHECLIMSEIYYFYGFQPWYSLLALKLIFEYALFINKSFINTLFSFSLWDCWQITMNNKFVYTECGIPLKALMGHN